MLDRDILDLLSANLGQVASANPSMDLDNDGTISLADHNQHTATLVSDSNGTGALQRDLNFDGDVDVSQIQIVNGQVVNIGDASQLLANLGQTAGYDSSATSALPESSSLAVAVIVGVAALIRRRRRGAKLAGN